MFSLTPPYVSAIETKSEHTFPKHDKLRRMLGEEGLVSDPLCRSKVGGIYAFPLLSRNPTKKEKIQQRIRRSLYTFLQLYPVLSMASSPSLFDDSPKHGNISKLLTNI